MMTLFSIQLSSWGKGLSLMIMLSLLVSCGNANKEQGTEEKVEAPSVPIHQATFFGDLKSIKQHIKAGTDLNVKDEYGSAPLAIASMFGKTEVALALIEAGADINVAGADGSTPLHTAAFLCRTEIVEALLEKGVKVDVRNSYGATALESIQMDFKDARPIYEQMGRDLGSFGLKIDYDFLEATRPQIAEMIGKHL